MLETVLSQSPTYSSVQPASNCFHHSTLSTAAAALSNSVASGNDGASTAFVLLRGRSETTATSRTSDEIVGDRDDLFFLDVFIVKHTEGGKQIRQHQATSKSWLLFQPFFFPFDLSSSCRIMAPIESGNMRTASFGCRRLTTNCQGKGCCLRSTDS